MQNEAKQDLRHNAEPESRNREQQHGDDGIDIVKGAILFDCRADPHRDSNCYCP